ncbi:MAG: arginine N-succinyltransferase [Bdellovibrionota bacterium]
MFRVRDVEPRDIDDLHRLSRQAVFLNLPSDKSQLTKLIARSQSSFKTRERTLERDKYVFVLEDTLEGRVVGTSSIIAQHGSPSEPHTYFQVLTKKKVSKSIHIGFLHQVLRLGFDYDGPTEIGGLVILPEYRGHAEKLGKFLSFARFLYIAARRTQFKDELLSELMPPFNERGESAIWEELGRKFTNLRYDEADRLSRRNMEFFTSLFPEGDIYTCMLSGEAREAIGLVGEDTQPVKKMLDGIGFKYKNMIDPFDGGPHYWAKTSQVDPVKRTQRVKLIGDTKKTGLVKKDGVAMSLDRARVRLVQGTFGLRKNEISFDSEQATALSVRDKNPELYFLEI